MSNGPDVPETLRDSRYRGLRVLGTGSQGTTFEATDVVVGRLVAVKRFAVLGAKTWKEVELAEREANVLAGIAHPLIPRYIEHFEEGGALYLVTEKIDGESLAAIRAGGGRLDAAETVRLLHDLGDALGYLHACSPPVVHRDVKPGNVIRRKDGRFALVDFGAVRDRLRPEGGSTVVGTFGYMAPEQFQGRAMPASDVYGAGATAIAMITGSEPETLPHRGLAIDVRAALGRGLPETLVRALETMLEPDPDRRSSKVALPASQGGEPAQGDRPPPGPADASRGSKRTRKEREREQRRRRDEDGGKHRRRARRERAADRWRQRARAAGSLTRLAMRVALAIAIVAVQLSLRIVVPVVLTMLSLVFGPKLRKTARRVAATGVRAAGALTRAHAQIDDVRLPEEDAELAGDAGTDEERPRARVAEQPAADDRREREVEAEREAEEHARQKQSARRRR